jgi:metallo-beta-lactamase family protein
MRLTPYGAARTVTGSCHLVEYQNYRLLLDCGAYQGSEDDRNNGPFGFEPATVDAVVISHAHHDHIGRLPLLIRQGYRGRPSPHSSFCR